MKHLTISKPDESDYPDYFKGYISLVDGNDLIAKLENRRVDLRSIILAIPEDKGTYRYEAGKWSIKELIGHIIDTERIMAYRALRFSRGDQIELEGFDQDPYVENADFDSYQLADLADEFDSVRKSNLFMFQGLSEEAWDRTGVASGNSVSVRALGYMLTGHEIHHTNILKERYLV